MNNKFIIALDWDTISLAATRSMKSAVENLEADLKARKSRKGTGMAIFHDDKEKDIAEIEKYIDAFNIVLKYYGEDR